MRLKKTNILIVFIVSLFLLSCDKKRVFDEYKKLNGKWAKKDTVQFDFEQTDTINPYNLFLNIRNNSDYPYNNLFLIVALKQPDDLVKIDTLEYEMAYPDGKLMGDGFTDIKESKLWYQENFTFKKQGKYSIKITQALRETGNIEGVEDLDGVTEVGFRIEKTN
jgi:gliding motility-associated lipoprotein GldH